MSTRDFYLLLILAVVAERLVELVVTRRHLRALRARGGVVVTRGDPWAAMVLLHAGLLVAAPLEVVLAGRRFVPVLGIPALVAVLATMALRWWTVSVLGDRWTARIVVVPGEGPITTGPFRWLRHPNYLAVIVEVAALPLVHSAWATALVATMVNAVVLRARIRAEEAALEDAEGYRDALGGRPRFVPRAITPPE